MIANKTVLILFLLSPMGSDKSKAQVATSPKEAGQHEQSLFVSHPLIRRGACIGSVLFR